MKKERCDKSAQELYEMSTTWGDRYTCNRSWRRMGKFYRDIPLHEANYMFDDEPLELAIINSFKYMYICIVASCWQRDEEHRYTIEKLVDNKNQIENHQRKINIRYNTKENKDQKNTKSTWNKRMTLKEIKKLISF